MPGGRRDRDLVVAGHRLELGGRVGDDRGDVDRLVRRRRGPASARASSSRSATSRRIRREERRAEAAASRCSPSRYSSSSSRLASTEVSGVRSSCEASATNSRWRASVASVSAARLAERREHRLQRARQLGHLVLGVRARDPHRRVARALDLARGRGHLGDRLHRAPRGGQAGQQREQAAAEHAEGQEHLHAVGGRLHVGEPLRVLDHQRVDVAEHLDAAATRRASRRRSRAARCTGPKFGAPVAAHHVVAARRDDPHRRVLAARRSRRSSGR